MGTRMWREKIACQDIESCAIYSFLEILRNFHIVRIQLGLRKFLVELFGLSKCIINLDFCLKELNNVCYLICVI